MLTDELLYKIWTSQSTYTDIPKAQLRYLAIAIEAEVLQAQEPIYQLHDDSVRSFTDVEKDVFDESKLPDCCKRIVYTAPQPPAPCPKCVGLQERYVIARDKINTLQAKVAEYEKSIGETNDALGIMDLCQITPLVAEQSAEIARLTKASEHWHAQYVNRCNYSNDRQAQLGGEIEGLGATIAQQAERIAELERELRQYKNVPTHPVVLRDKTIKEQAALIEKLGDLLRRGTYEAIDEARKAIAAQKGDAA